MVVLAPGRPMVGGVVSLAVMVWARLALCVTVPPVEVLVLVGAAVAVGLVSLGHSTVASAGKFTKLGGVVSLSVMVWAWLALLPQESVTVQVRVMTLIT